MLLQRSIRGSLRRLEGPSRHQRKHGAATAVAAAAVALFSASATVLLTHDENENEQQEEQLGSSAISLPSSSMFISRCESAGFAPSSRWRFPSALQRSQTASLLEDTRNKKDQFERKYDVDWDHALGEGAFGAVYSAVHTETGERVAIKQISKDVVDDPQFEKEIDALLRLRHNGGHPNILSIRENFETSKQYLIVMDYIGGKELFDQLCDSGSYSEAEAARHIREVASALAFLHGIDIVHADIKPENLMLSSTDINNSVLKVVDFGNAHIIADDLGHAANRQKVTAKSPSYCPPEVLEELMDNENEDGLAHIAPSFDMWSLGIVIYIMLVGKFKEDNLVLVVIFSIHRLPSLCIGMHPFDPRAAASPDEIESRVLTGRKPPLRNSRYTRHLSKDAIDLIDGLMEWDPSKRLTALEVLNNPWVQGQTSRQQKMANSDKRLSQYRKFKTRIGSTFFKAFITSKDSVQPPHLQLNKSRRTKSGRNDDGTLVGQEESMLQSAFRRLDHSDRGYLSADDIIHGNKSSSDSSAVSYSEASLLLAETMKNRYYPKGHTIYKAGDSGDSLYLIDSGTIQVTSHDEQGGTSYEKVRKSGDLIGLGNMMNQSRMRGLYEQTATCTTPVHVIEIPRHVFEKYIKTDHETALSMEETTRHIRRERANAILRSNSQCYERTYRQGETIFRAGTKDRDPSLVFIDQGEVDLVVPGPIKVREVQPGEIMGKLSMTRVNLCVLMIDQGH